MLPLGFFFWLFITPFFSVVSIMLGLYFAIRLKRRKHSAYWWVALFIPVISFVSYLTVDWFEDKGVGYTVGWWLLMAVASWWAVPLFFKTRGKHKKNT